MLIASDEWMWRWGEVQIANPRAWLLSCCPQLCMREVCMFLVFVQLHLGFSGFLPQLNDVRVCDRWWIRPIPGTSWDIVQGHHDSVSIQIQNTSIIPKEIACDYRLHSTQQHENQIQTTQCHIPSFLYKNNIDQAYYCEAGE